MHYTRQIDIRLTEKKPYLINERRKVHSMVKTRVDNRATSCQYPNKTKTRK